MFALIARAIGQVIRWGKLPTAVGFEQKRQVFSVVIAGVDDDVEDRALYGFFSLVLLASRPHADANEVFFTDLGLLEIAVPAT